MIKVIPAAQTLPLRSLVLRNNAGIEKSIFPGDTLADTVHLGYFVEEAVVCVATFFSVALPAFAGKGRKLRGMATAPDFTGKGYGSALISYALARFKSEAIDYIWCNARTSAVPFYEKFGFKRVSEEFYIENIGPHYQMLLKLEV